MKIQCDTRCTLKYDSYDLKVCVFDLAPLFSDDLSLHFCNQSEINSEAKIQNEVI